MCQFTITTAYVLQDDQAEGFLAADPLAAELPDIILVFDTYVVALCADGEAEWYASLHCLQIAHSLEGGDLDQLYHEDEDCLREWQETDTAEIADMIDGAFNCTPGFEGQTVRL